jgi:soluble lytic murein transglycosylase-like protein
MFSKLILIASILLTLSSAAFANPFIEASERYKVDAWLLYAIAKHESGLNPYAVNRNKNGSVDVGVMQINSIHFPTLAKLGIPKESLWNPETNIQVGAWVLAQCIQKHGYTTNALNCYNGDKTGRYSEKVMAIFKKETSKYKKEETVCVK